MNNVTYTIALTPENAAKIDAVNRILLGDDYTAEAPTKAESATKSPAEKPATQTKTATKAPAKKSQATSSDAPTLDDVKAAAKKAKAEHGEDFAKEVLEAAGVELAATLGGSMCKIPEDMYQAVIEVWEEGPTATEQAADEPEDDDFDDLDEEESEAEVTPEAVKTAIKAYAKETGRDEAKELMAKYGATSLSAIDKLAPAKLAKLMAELV